jgi:N-acetylmuramoyl-L-alanine amidase
LDAGHGYKSINPTGARGLYNSEDDVVLDICQRLKHYLHARGVATVETRPGKAFVALGGRGRIAKREKCDMFVSIHANAVNDPSAHGCEVLVAEGDARSAVLAAEVAKVLNKHGMTLRGGSGVKWDNEGAHKSLRVLRDTYRTMPAMLVELGFLTNPQDAALMKQSRWREDVACDLAKALAPNA